jgi:serine/threonine protein phosphatase PrpC
MIPTKTPHLSVAATSHAGMSGKNNEDRYGVAAHSLDRQGKTPSVLAVVADGIGGHRAGEVAAEIAVEVINRSVSDSSGEQPLTTLVQAIKRASQEILQESRRDPEQKGMGSTCACAWVIGNRLYTASVGDTRIYLMRAGRIQQLSMDHTWVQEALSNGAITPEQARGHPNAHIIRRYLGSVQEVVPDTRMYLTGYEDDDQAVANQGMVLQPGDILLLCTDGLTDLVGNPEIAATAINRQGEEAIHKLVGMANQRGGHDNITIVELQMPNEVKIEKPVKRRYGLACAVSALAVAAIFAIVAGGYWFFKRSGGGLPPIFPTQPAGIMVELTPTFDALQPVTPLPVVPGDANPAASPIPGEFLQPTSTAGVNQPPAATLTPWPTNTLIP